MNRAFATMLETSAAPYGYTVAIWCSGALLMHFHGTPGVGEVFGFLAGALGGFTLLGALGAGVAKRAKPFPPGLARVLAGMMDWFAVGIAVGAATGIAQIGSWAAWPLVSLAATIIYLGFASLQLAVAAQTER